MSAFSSASNLRLALAPLAIMLCVAGCSKGPTPQERIRQEREARENKLDPQIAADWENLVNDMAPARPLIHDFDNLVHEVEKEGAAASFNRQVEQQEAQVANAARGE